MVTYKKLSWASPILTVSIARRVLCVLLAAGLVVPAVFAAAVVVCLSPNGHIEVEDLDAPCCGASKLPSHAPVPRSNEVSQLPRSGNCGACVDIPVSALAASPPVVPTDLGIVTGSQGVGPLAIQLAGPAAHAPAGPPMSRVRVSLALRSVLLRC